MRVVVTWADGSQESFEDVSMVRPSDNIVELRLRKEDDFEDRLYCSLLTMRYYKLYS